MPELRIKRVSEMGFCFGVRRALEQLHAASRDYKNIPTLGPIVHNPRVVENMEGTGIRVINKLSETRGKVIGITTHGISPRVMTEIKQKFTEIIDTTCPTVRRAQKVAEGLSRDGYWVVIYGEMDHPEVKGLVGWATDRATATRDYREVLNIKPFPKKIGVISQTTQSIDEFKAFTANVLQHLPYPVGEVRLINTICATTQKRQDEALKLAESCDLMVIVGGLNSSNTKRLVEVCSRVVDTCQVESASTITPQLVEGKKIIGISAGTSTPDEAIEEVVAKLKIFLEQLDAKSAKAVKGKKRRREKRP